MTDQWSQAHLPRALTEALTHIRRYFPPTPVVEAHALSAAVGGRVWLKLESTTPVRTFKVRGALNRLRTLAAQGPVPGVATASAGNHGLGVAWSARQMGIPALVVVPANANPQKVALLQAIGAEVMQHGVDFFAAFHYMQQEAARRGWPVVHAYDDPDVIAGQGTVGLELLEQVPEMDCVLVGVGGGGLIGGVAAAIKERRPAVRIVGVQMAGADSMARSLAAGSVVGIDQVRTIADGLGARAPGQHCFALARRYVDEVIVLDDDALWPAMTLLLQGEHQVAEPAGAAATAALLQYGAARFGRQPVVVISGGNEADAVLAQVCARIHG
jgi:threonine dehydratase